MHSNYVRCLNPVGFHRMAYKEWGSADNDRVLVCVHGLARNSRDFDDLALALSRDYRVICPDVVGRGESEWLPAGQAYGVPQYMNDLTTLLARLNVDKVDWVGTSMGGIIGMCMAALPNSPIKNLVINDIGGFVSSKCLQRISEYLGDKRFQNLTEVEAYMRSTYLSYRNISDQQWRRLAKTGSKQLESGEFSLHYDPAIAESTKANSEQDIDLWPVWSQISVPQLLIWGDASDVLEAETVERMTENPQLELFQVAGIEHPPSLMESEHIQKIQNWLREHRNK